MLLNALKVQISAHTHLGFCKDSLRQFILKLNLGLQEVRPWLRDPGDKPYGRSPVYSDSNLEVIVMTWSRNLPCLPHDHGQAFGWVKILSGSVIHTVYEQDTPGSWPTAGQQTLEETGTLLYAPPGMVHAMMAAPAEPVVTLHFYTPSIQEMRVFDLERKRACIVADDCGAWWPEPHQLIRELSHP